MQVFNGQTSSTFIYLLQFRLFHLLSSPEASVILRLHMNEFLPSSSPVAASYSLNTTTSPPFTFLCRLPPLSLPPSTSFFAAFHYFSYSDIPLRILWWNCFYCPVHTSPYKGPADRGLYYFHICYVSSFDHSSSPPSLHPLRFKLPLGESAWAVRQLPPLHPTVNRLRIKPGRDISR